MLSLPTQGNLQQITSAAHALKQKNQHSQAIQDDMGRAPAVSAISVDFWEDGKRENHQHGSRDAIVVVREIPLLSKPFAAVEIEDFSTPIHFRLST